MTVDDLIRELTAISDKGDGEFAVNVIHASSGEQEHKVSGKFPLLAVDAEHGVNLIQSNYCIGYVPVVYPEPNE